MFICTAAVCAVCMCERAAAAAAAASAAVSSTFFVLHSHLRVCVCVFAQHADGKPRAEDQVKNYCSKTENLICIL